MFGGFKKTPYLCTRLQKARAFSSAGLEHLPYKQRVGGSNPSTPTRSSKAIWDSFFDINDNLDNLRQLYFVKYQKINKAEANFSLFTLLFSLLFRTFALSLRQCNIIIKVLRESHGIGHVDSHLAYRWPLQRENTGVGRIFFGVCSDSLPCSCGD